MIQQEKLLMIKELLGEEITEKDLANLELFVGKHMGIFIPTNEQFQHTTQMPHSHPSYAFMMYPIKENTYALEEYCTFVGVSPHRRHEEEVKERFTRYTAILYKRISMKNVIKNMNFKDLRFILVRL